MFNEIKFIKDKKNKLIDESQEWESHELYKRAREGYESMSSFSSDEKKLYFTICDLIKNIRGQIDGINLLMSDRRVIYDSLSNRVDELSSPLGEY